MAVEIPDAVLQEAYQWALRQAQSKAQRQQDIAEEMLDAATDAVLWCVERCTSVETFKGFVRATVQRWLSRKVAKARMKCAHRVPVGVITDEIRDGLESRNEKPAAPLLIEDLPEDLAFIVRLYMVDGYNCRDIGLLVNQSHNTVNLKLKRAAEMLAAGRMDKPERRKGEKRLTAG